VTVAERARVPDGPPPMPVVQRLRLRYAKRGRVRFSSHRDFQRAFERALRRAGVPMAYSAGFTPHPKVSYANAAATGVASEAEYLEIGLVRACDPAQVRDHLDACLPAGLDVLEIVAAPAGSSLAERLEASVFEIRLPGVTDLDAGAAADTLLAQPEVQVERLTKNGIRRFDVRSAVVGLGLAASTGPAASAGPDERVGEPDGHEPPRSCAILRLVVRHATPAVRPDDVLAALCQVADLAPPEPALVTRLAQGPLDTVTGAVSDPLAPDRA
jgi:radical SAM-linked protein